MALRKKGEKMEPARKKNNDTLTKKNLKATYIRPSCPLIIKIFIYSSFLCFQ